MSSAIWNLEALETFIRGTIQYIKEGRICRKMQYQELNNLNKIGCPPLPCHHNTTSPLKSALCPLIWPAACPPLPGILITECIRCIVYSHLTPHLSPLPPHLTSCPNLSIVIILAPPSNYPTLLYCTPEIMGKHRKIVLVGGGGGGLG